MRQFGCIELTLNDALLLRDAIRPLSKVEPYDPITVVRFCERLYEGILRLKTGDDIKTINIRLEEQDALFINHFVGNEDWQNAMNLLEQTWLVLYELRHQSVFPRGEREAAAAIDQLAQGSAQPPWGPDQPYARY
jgi:hypothetical protein